VLEHQKKELLKTLKRNDYPKDVAINKVDIDKTNLKLKIKKIST